MQEKRLRLSGLLLTIRIKVNGKHCIAFFCFNWASNVVLAIRINVLILRSFIDQAQTKLQKSGKIAINAAPPTPLIHAWVCVCEWVCKEDGRKIDKCSCAHFLDDCWLLPWLWLWDGYGYGNGFLAWESASASAVAAAQALARHNNCRRSSISWLLPAGSQVDYKAVKSIGNAVKYFASRNNCTERKAKSNMNCSVEKDWKTFYCRLLLPLLAEII